MNPLVSIIIPTYNNAKTIISTLKSVQLQTYSFWECIIIDDASTDKNSSIIISDFIKKDKRFKFIIRSKTLIKGSSTCRNIGINMAIGKYVVFLDSDDLLAPFCLKNRVKAFENNSDNDFLVFQMQRFVNSPNIKEDSTLSVRKKNDDILDFLRLTSVWQVTSPIYKYSYLNSIETFNEKLTNYEDIELAIRAIYFSKSYLIFDNIDSFYRNDENYSAKYSSMEVKDRIVKSFYIFLQAIHNTLIRDERNDKIKLYREQLVFAYKKVFLVNIKDSINIYIDQNREILSFLSSNGYLSLKQKTNFYLVQNIISKFYRVKGFGVYRFIKYLYTLD